MKNGGQGTAQHSGRPSWTLLISQGCTPLTGRPFHLPAGGRKPWHSNPPFAVGSSFVRELYWERSASTPQPSTQAASRESSPTKATFNGFDCVLSVDGGQVTAERVVERLDEDAPDKVCQATGERP